MNDVHDTRLSGRTNQYNPVSCDVHYMNSGDFVILPLRVRSGPCFDGPLLERFGFS